MVGNVGILPRKQHLNSDAQIAAALREMVLGLVDEINEYAGEQMLYVNECAEHLFLYGRPAADRLDKLMMLVPIDIDGLARLWCRLRGAVEGV